MRWRWIRGGLLIGNVVLDLIGQLGLYGMGIAGLAWLVRQVFVRWLDKDVLRYRSELQDASDIAIETLRNDFRLRSIEHEIRFGSLYARQAAVIAKTYEFLVHAHKAVCSYVAQVENDGQPSISEKQEEFTRAYEEFRSYFYPNRIFFPKETGDRVGTLADNMAELANLFTRETRGLPRSPERAQRNSVRMESLQEQIPELLHQLHQDFQFLLGMTRQEISSST